MQVLAHVFKTSLKESGEATNFKNKSLWIFVILMQKNGEK